MGELARTAWSFPKLEGKSWKELERARERESESAREREREISDLQMQGRVTESRSSVMREHDTPLSLARHI